MKSTGDTAKLLIEKSHKLYGTACAIFDLGDWESCISRAYYSMFNAAKSAVLISGAPVKQDFARTHSGLIAAFSNYIIKEKIIPKEVGNQLGKVQEIRLMADYKDEEIDEKDARDVLNRAKQFINAIDSLYFPNVIKQLDDEHQKESVDSVHVRPKF